jgi:hypothetical protein
MSSDEYDFCKEFPRPDLDVRAYLAARNMGVLCQTHPSLGQVNLTVSNTIDITAVLHIPGRQNASQWDVSLWHSQDGGEWSESQLSQITNSQEPEWLQPQNNLTTTAYFRASFSFQESMKYTVKYRKHSDTAWSWVQDVVGIGDGTIILKPSSRIPLGLGDVIPDLTDEWTVQSWLSQSPNTQLWSLETFVPHSEADRAGTCSLRIGTPWGGPLR